MAFEVTYNCDVCGTVGGAESTRPKARASAKHDGWAVIRVDGRERLVCGVCLHDHGGTNVARRIIRESAR